MTKSKLFGAARATTIAALCAGAGLALAGCSKTEAPAKPATGGSATEKGATEKSCGGDKKCAGDKAGAEKKCGADGKSCGADKKCGQNSCGSTDKK